jgi:glycosyltransferase involved in cell wall biosynthesis
MKIAYVLNTYPQRSHSFIRRELHALERRGVQVLRLAMRRADQAMSDPLDKAEEARTEHVLAAGPFALIAATLRQFAGAPGPALAALRLALRTGRLSDKGIVRHLIYFAEACYVAARCKAEAVDHTHAHFGTNAATVAMLTHALTGIPFSFTVHGPEEFDSPRSLSLGEKTRRAAFTVAISQFGRSQLCRWADPKVWKDIHVVHCGIEPAAFRDPPPLPGGPPRLVCIGRFAEQKGHLILVEAMAALRQSVPDLHLTLVGDGEMRAQIEDAIRAHGLQAAVSITGWVGEDRIRAELAAAHALVAPSFAEGLPMVVMEAMAAARPVIATYVAGNPELVQPGQTGWLVPAGDVAALAAGIHAMAETPTGDLRAMGLKGRDRVLQRHDIDAEAGRLIDLFTASVASDKKPAKA